MESKNQQKPIYTVGVWTARSGKEKEFIGIWSDFAQWMSKNTSGVGTGVLLQDPQNPAKFFSIGPWDDLQSVQAWRESQEFKDFAARAMAVCEDFQPNMLQLVSSSE